MTLLQDIEAATEGSRELSDRVLEALKLWRHRDFPNPPYLDMRKYQRWDTPHRSLWFSASSLNDNRDDIGLRLPDPTRNLQDALQLVPEGCEGQIDFGAPPIDWQIWNGKFGHRVYRVLWHGRHPCPRALRGVS